MSEPVGNRAKREPTMGLAERLREMPDIVAEAPDVADWTVRDMDRLRAAADAVEERDAAVARVAALEADRAALAAVVGDLWDNPPDDGPDCGPSDPAGYALWLHERYGVDVAMVWDRLASMTGYIDDGDRWTIAESPETAR